MSSTAMNGSTAALAAPEDPVRMYAMLVLPQLLKAISVIGVVSNVVIFIALYRFVHDNRKLQVASVLQYMCVADTVCLLAMIIYGLVSHGLFLRAQYPSWLKTLFCKTSMYLIHTNAAFSTWCLLTLSTARYLAVFRPLKFRRTISVEDNNMGKVMGVVFGCCAAVQIWLAVVVEFDGQAPQPDCVASVKVIGESVQLYLCLLDLSVTFWIPLVVTASLDYKLKSYQKQKMCQLVESSHLFCPSRVGSEMVRWDGRGNGNGNNGRVGHRSPVPSGDPPSRPIVRYDTVDAQYCSVGAPPDYNALNETGGGGGSAPVLQQQQQQQQPEQHQPHPAVSGLVRQVANVERQAKMLNRYLLITWIDLAFNCLHVVIRQLDVLGVQHVLGPRAQILVSSLAYALYYAQFSLNWLYVWVLYSYIKPPQRNTPVDNL